MRQIDATLACFGDDPRFTGSVAGLHIGPEEDPQLHAYVVSFASGGRTS